MRYSRPARIILGILVIALFFGYQTLRLRDCVMSGDLGESNRNSDVFSSQEIQELPQPEYDLPADMQAPGDMQVSDDMQASSDTQVPADMMTDPAAAPEAAPEATLSPIMQTAADNAAALGLPMPPNINIGDWQYVLVNGDHPIDPPYYEPSNLVYLNMTGDDTDIRTEYDGNRQVVDGMIAPALIEMVQACKAAGLPVYLSSGYRSYDSQAANFQRVNNNNGITDGKDGEGNYITMPAGCSEHQTGLCIDITDRYWEIKNDAIAETPTVQWLAENCAQYGFVLRFPVEKRGITHVMGESWHFRYVGVEAAQYMTENNLCLEEFVALYGVA